MLEWILVHGSLIAFFILANSFFVAAEFALITVRETRIEHLIALNRPGARTALHLKHNIDEVLPAAQFGVTLASLALGGIGEPALADAIGHGLRHVPWLGSWFSRLPGAAQHPALYVHSIAVVVAFALITYFEVLLGELVPKSLALQRAERIALAVAAPVDVFIRITRPAVKLMNASAAVVLRLFRSSVLGESAAHSPEELKLLATATRKVGLLPQFQEEMVHRTLELGALVASEVMTPRGRVFSLSSDLLLEDASARIVEEQFSRVPVYEPKQGRDHIVGVVYAKDIARLMHFRSMTQGLGNRGPSGIKLRHVMREVLLVPETKLAMELLQDFQQRRRQMAIVVDEFGSTLGLVTAEDVLEQVVGEMEDEYDTRNRLSMPGSGGSVLLEGSTSLRDLATQLRWVFPREGGVETLAGFLLSRFGHIPRAGEAVDFDGRTFTVERLEGKRIAQVRVDPQTEEAIGEPTGGDGRE